MVNNTAVLIEKNHMHHGGSNFTHYNSSRSLVDNCPKKADSGKSVVSIFH